MPLPNQSDFSIIRIPYKKIFFCNERGLIKELADFSFLKRLYGNSCIFDYSIKKLSGKSGFSRTKIRRLVKLFLKLGWCEIHCENLIFKKPKGKYYAGFKTEFNSQSIKENINLVLLRNKYRQTQKAFKVKCDLKNPATLSDYKTALRLERKMKLRGERTQNFNISLKKLASVFNCSKSMVRIILNQLKVKGLIQIIRNRIVTRCNPKMFQAMKDKAGYTFYHRGFAFLIKPNTITFPKGLS